MESRLVTAAMVLAAAVLGAAATQGTMVAAVVVALALLVCGFAVLGPRRFGIVALGGAFLTAPFYRGIGSVGPITPTDGLLLLGLVTLLPIVLRRQLVLPGAFVVPVIVLGVMGLVASATNASPVAAVIYLFQWLLVFAGLPVFLVMWAPPRRIIDGLLGCYVAGQVISIGKALIGGANPFTERYQGLSHHPNDFGLAGAAAVAILLYLLPHYKDLRARVMLLGLIAVNLYSIVMSGSRGATLAVAVVIVMVPIAERSGLWALLVTAAGAAGLALLPFVISFGGAGGSLARLAGDKTSQGSDSERTAALADGWDKFLHSPFIGIGLDPLVGIYHNVFLEVAIAFGVFGVAAYLAFCYVFARPLFTAHPLRRLSYLTWLFLVVGLTFPGLNDRTIAIPMAMGILAAVPRRSEAADEPIAEVATAR